MEAGAGAIIAQKDIGLKEQVLVKDTRAAYSIMCGNFMGSPAQKLKLVGVTGTNGKTTTSFLLKDIFEALGEKTGLIGTVKNMAGDEEYPSSLTTPDPLELHTLFARMVEKGCTYCVMEVSSQALAQERVAGLHFEAGIFTNLTHDHLDYHGSFENYMAAKKKLFEICSLAVVNLDDDAAIYMLEGLNAGASLFPPKRTKRTIQQRSPALKARERKYELVGSGIIGRVHFGVPGPVSVYIRMGAAQSERTELGFPFQKVIETLAMYKGVPGRLEIVRQILIILL